MDEKNIIKFLSEFHDEQTCYDYLVNLRWPDGVICVDCGSTNVYKPSAQLFRCTECKHKFSVRVDTLFYRTSVPLNKWFTAIYLFTQTSKGISSLQLAKNIEVTQKTAWFMLHRMRKAIEQSDGSLLTGLVQADETYVGGKARNRHANDPRKSDHGRSTATKQPIVGFLADSGETRAFTTQDTRSDTLKRAVTENVAIDAHLVTDSYLGYKNVPQAKRTIVQHNVGEYVKNGYHTNGIESFWATLKRGIFGIYHHTSRHHMQAYVDEYAFRSNVKNGRIDSILGSMLAGDRLSYESLIK